MTYIAEPHIWRFNTSADLVAPNYIEASIGFAAYVAMDFRQLMASDDSISTHSTPTVSDIGGATEPTISSHAISDDKQRVEIKLATASATANTYTFTSSIVTTNGETIIGKGRLVLS